MGAAIADYWRGQHVPALRVLSPGFDPDEMPVASLFRTFDEMPPLEQTALRLARGRILDVGAGAGCHSMALQQMGHDVTAIDISPLSVETMRAQGIRQAFEQDFWTVTDRYDTIMMLMNGIGIVGNLDKLPHFFAHIANLLNTDGQLIIDSSDVCYIFEDGEGRSLLRRNKNGIMVDPETGRYYGEFRYEMRYKRIRGAQFSWLYIDFPTLSATAAANGFRAELLQEGDHYDYLARITHA